MFLLPWCVAFRLMDMNVTFITMNLSFRVCEKILEFRTGQKHHVSHMHIPYVSFLNNWWSDRLPCNLDGKAQHQQLQTVSLFFDKCTDLTFIFHLLTQTAALHLQRVALGRCGVAASRTAFNVGSVGFSANLSSRHLMI